jgi:hypothetical protein
MDNKKMDELKDQINEAVRDAKIEELAGCLMDLHQVQTEMTLGALPEEDAMDEAKVITRRAVELHHEIKELMDESGYPNDQDLIGSADLGWLDDFSDGDADK